MNLDAAAPLIADTCSTSRRKHHAPNGRPSPKGHPPGGYDALHTGQLFPSSNSLGIPDLLPVGLEAIPEYLAPYHARVRRRGVSKAQVGIHFYLDDYKFEAAWSQPRRALRALAGYGALLTPDFSIYRDWPLAARQWNAYRARWLGRFWQQAGYPVIPASSWGAPDTYAWCFLGLPARSVIAISTIGANLRRRAARRVFEQGLDALLSRLDPLALVCYGKLPGDLRPGLPVYEYPCPRYGQLAVRRET